MNWFIGCNPAPTLSGLTPSPKGWRPKLTQVHDTSVKVLLIETDERYVVDGQTALSQPPGIAASWCNLMSDRHDLVHRKMADWKPDGTHGDAIDHASAMGNAAFCDGHAEYVPRSFVHSRLHSVPNLADFPGYTEPTMINP